MVNLCVWRVWRRYIHPLPSAVPCSYSHRLFTTNVNIWLSNMPWKLHNILVLSSEMRKERAWVHSKKCWKSKEIGQKTNWQQLRVIQLIFLVTWVSWALPFNLSKCFTWHFWLFCSSPGREANIYISLTLVAELHILHLCWEHVHLPLCFYVSRLPSVFGFFNL